MACERSVPPDVKRWTCAAVMLCCQTIISNQTKASFIGAHA
jgi:hypothetical protein